MLVYFSKIQYLMHKATGRPTDLKAIFAPLFALNYWLREILSMWCFGDSIRDFVAICNFSVIFCDVEAWRCMKKVSDLICPPPPSPRRSF